MMSSINAERRHQRGLVIDRRDARRRGLRREDGARVRIEGEHDGARTPRSRACSTTSTDQPLMPAMDAIECADRQHGRRGREVVEGADDAH